MNDAHSRLPRSLPTTAHQGKEQKKKALKWTRVSFQVELRRSVYSPSIPRGSSNPPLWGVVTEGKRQQQMSRAQSITTHQKCQEGSAQEAESRLLDGAQAASSSLTGS